MLIKETNKPHEEKKKKTTRSDASVLYDSLWSSKTRHFKRDPRRWKNNLSITELNI